MREKCHSYSTQYSPNGLQLTARHPGFARLVSLVYPISFISISALSPLLSSTSCDQTQSPFWSLQRRCGILYYKHLFCSASIALAIVIILVH
ncbi:hypothetical protein V8C44DRAFT_227339 [Trichoderma aethiopicum]